MIIPHLFLSKYISTTVLMEVGYILRRKFGEDKVNGVIAIIEAFENLHIIPVTSEVAVHASQHPR
jgi:predicted nucleic acid-binding protein